MPWTETDRMNERVKFMARYLENDEDQGAVRTDGEVRTADTR